jgi:hypothetical protein
LPAVSRSSAWRFIGSGGAPIAATGGFSRRERLFGLAFDLDRKQHAEDGTADSTNDGGRGWPPQALRA